MAAIEFKSSAQTSFDDVIKLRQLAQEQGQSALTNLTGAVKTVGDDYTKQNDAQVQAMINAQTYDQSQDPEHQAMLQQKLQDFTQEKHGMVSLGAMETARDNRGVTLEARKADQDKNTAFLMEQDRLAQLHPYRLQKEQLGVDGLIISNDASQLALEESAIVAKENQDKRENLEYANTYRGIQAALSAGPEKNPEGYKIALAQQAEFENTLSKLPIGRLQQMYDTAESQELKKLTESILVTNSDLRNQKLVSDIAVQEQNATTASTQVNNNFLVDQAKLEQGSYNQASASYKEEAKENKALDDAALTGTGYTKGSIVNGRPDPALVGKQLTAKISAATSQIGFGTDNHTNFNDFARKFPAKKLTDRQQEDLYKALEGQKISEHEKIAVWDAVVRGEVKSKNFFGDLTSYQGGYEKGIKNFLADYNKNTLPRLQLDAKKKVYQEHLNLYNNASAGGIGAMVEDLGVKRGNFSDYAALPDVVKKQVGMNDAQYKFFSKGVNLYQNVDKNKGKMTHGELALIKRDYPNVWKHLISVNPKAEATLNKLNSDKAAATKKANDSQNSKNKTSTTGNRTYYNPRGTGTGGNKDKKVATNKDKSKPKDNSKTFSNGNKTLDDVLNKNKKLK